MCHGETQWIDTVLLLGLRTCIKKDLLAELIYNGTTLKVLGEFFSSEELPIFIEDFRVITQKLQLRPTSHYIRLKLFLKICITVLTSSLN